MPTIVELDNYGGDKIRQLDSRPRIGRQDELTGQTTLGVHVPEHTHVVDEEALVLNRRLEALQAVPRHVSGGGALVSPMEMRRLVSSAVLDSDPSSLSDEDEVLSFP